MQFGKLHSLRRGKAPHNALFLSQNHGCSGRKDSFDGLHYVSQGTHAKPWIKVCWQLGQSKIGVVGKWILIRGSGYQNYPWCHYNIISKCMTLIIRRKQKKNMSSTSNYMIPLVWKGESRAYSIMKSASGGNLRYCACRPAQSVHAKAPQGVLGACGVSDTIKGMGLFLEK